MPRTVIRNITIFDGNQVLPFDAVLLDGPEIAAIGHTSALSVDATVVDAPGHTLLPGLIDSHTHIVRAEEQLRQAAMLGVTTVLDMFSDVRLSTAVRQRLARDEPGTEDLADLRTSGTAVTAPGGHCTQYPLVPDIPTIRGPEEAEEFVAARIREGSDYIKLIYDDGHSRGLHMPTLSGATLRAVIEAAHRMGRIAIVHVMEMDRAVEAIEAGADGLAHLFADKQPIPDFGRLAARHGAFVVPTLSILESTDGVAGAADLAEHPGIGPWLVPSAAATLAETLPMLPDIEHDYHAAEMAVRLLRSSGAAILAGTDAPNPGTAYGASLHRELELLVRAGLGNIEALAAATAVPAAVFGLHDRGRIAPGLRADLLLVAGHPFEDITMTRNIVAVWCRGRPVDRQKRRAELEANRPRRPRRSTDGAISDFTGDTPRTRFGSWLENSDALVDGGSSVRTAVVTDNGVRALRVFGEIVPDFEFPWAGVAFIPGPTPFLPADLSDWRGIRFRARGEGSGYFLMMIADSLGTAPPRRPVAFSPQWQEIGVPFTDFGNADGSDVKSLLFAAGESGPFEFYLADLCLWR